MKSPFNIGNTLLSALFIGVSTTVKSAPAVATNDSLLQSVFDNTQAKAVEVNHRLGEMITIPAGSFLMGNNGHEGFEGPEEFPQHSVYLPAYQIAKYEVTRGEFRKFIEAG